MADLDRRIAGAVLAGGKSRRMNGLDKSRLALGGLTLLERTIGVLEQVFEEVIIVGLAADRGDFLHRFPVVEDRYSDAGPLGGIHAGLWATTKSAVFFVACDMPFLDPCFMRNQLSHYDGDSCDVLIPRMGRYLEPLHGIYSRRLERPLARFIEDHSERSIRSFLRDAAVEYVDLEERDENRRMFTNLNTPADFADAENTLDA